MSVKYFVENILLCNNGDVLLVSPEDSKWIHYNDLDENVLHMNVENISCVPDLVIGRQIWHIYCW